MKRVFASLAALLAFSAPASAQQAWFVDPVNGNDVNGGQAEDDAFRSLTHALAQASAGDDISCLPGTYSGQESFPIGIRDGIQIRALGGDPVFDGQGAPLLFELAEPISVETELGGLGFADADTLVSLAGQPVDGLVLRDCSFSDCLLGVDAPLGLSAGSQGFDVRGSVFSSAAGTAAIRITVPFGTTLDAGGIVGNQILGAFDAGILITAQNAGTVAAAFAVERNIVAGCDRGIELSAAGGGGSAVSVATVSAAVTANRLTGDGSPSSRGLLLQAEVGVVGEDAVLDSVFEFNEIADFGVAVDVVSTNDGNNDAEVVPEFYGNVLRGELSGVRLTATLPNPLNRNADPNFGGHPEGGTASLNSFEGFTTDFDLAINQTHNQYAQFCWFDGAPVSQDGILLTAPILDDPLEAAPLGTVLANAQDVELLVTAGSTSGFVDFAGPGGVGQILAELDGVELDQADLEAGPLGVSLTVLLPELAEGTHVLKITNPGGQSGEFSFRAAFGGADGTGAGCFVATAAHGDYDAPEVLALRALRDEYLATSAPGRAFVRWYYREGPAAAAWIAERPWARAGARVALQPAVWTARALTGWKPAERFACGLLLLGAAFALLRRRA